MTSEITSTGPGPQRVIIFSLANPATGNKTLSASWTGVSDFVLGAINFSGVNQTTPVVVADSAAANGTSTAPSVTVTSDINGATIAGLSAQVGINAETQTQIFRVVGNMAADATYALGGTSNVHGFTLASSAGWATAGIHVQQVQAAGAPDPTFAAHVIQSALRW